MRIAEFLRPELVLPELRARDKQAVLSELAAAAAPALGLPAGRVLAVLVDREQIRSTGVGEGVAIPHAKLPGAPRLVAVVGRSRDGVDFAAADGKPARLFFALFSPENSPGVHLKALARISRLCNSPQFRSAILAAKDAGGMLSLINVEDSKD